MLRIFFVSIMMIGTGFASIFTERDEIDKAIHAATRLPLAQSVGLVSVDYPDGSMTSLACVALSPTTVLLPRHVLARPYSSLAVVFAPDTRVFSTHFATLFMGQRTGVLSATQRAEFAQMQSKTAQITGLTLHPTEDLAIAQLNKSIDVAPAIISDALAPEIRGLMVSYGPTYFDGSGEMVSIDTAHASAVTLHLGRLCEPVGAVDKSRGPATGGASATGDGDPSAGEPAAPIVYRRDWILEGDVTDPTNRRVVRKEGDRTPFTNSGDSGAAIFVNEGGTFQLAAIHRGRAVIPETREVQTHAIPLAPHKPWIEETVRRLSGGTAKETKKGKKGRKKH